LAIVEFLKNYFSDRNIVKNKNLKALVTAGPTKEYIDPVRFITNNSSGKQGYEIASSLAKFGVETTLISGPSALKKPENVNIIKVESADQMYAETKKALPVDIAVCTAAITDFKPEKYETKKIKKDNLNIKFKRNIDILEFLSKNNLSSIQESPLTMLIPSCLLAIGAIITGILFKEMFIGSDTQFWRSPPI